MWYKKFLVIGNIKKVISFSLFPNILSVLRLMLTPVFILFLFREAYFESLVIFTIAILTDFYDGLIARKYSLVSKSGNFLDPFADKVLVLAVFVAFYTMHIIDIWMLSLLIVRDGLITVLRVAMLHSGESLVTSSAGKWKTGLQFVAIYLVVFWLWLQFGCQVFRHYFFWGQVFYVGIIWFIYGVVIFSVYSGMRYIVNNRVVFFTILSRKTKRA